MAVSAARQTLTLLKMLLVVAVFFAATYYFTISFTSQDWIWFTSGFDSLPYRVLVYDAGKVTEYRTGVPGFDLLAGSIRDGLDRGVARQSGVGLSGESLEEAYSQYLSVEAFFPSPVKLHASFYTGNPTQMLFPITGRHSDLSVVFLGSHNGYYVNAPALKDIQPLRRALVQLGYSLPGD